MTTGPIEVRAGHVLLHLKVTPKARKAEIGGLISDAQGRPRLVVKVTAPPDQGKANAAVLAALAARLGLAISRLELVRGTTAREKTVEIEAEPQLIATALGLDVE
ncbi:hypothetical protein SAMN07250955_101121 [Arboricoccus pini]|uniref:UPF0235 protein SAMN07250955_101121 n=1 Tax=Arboricoccus pini TaxID=1963835 RepID=A0A212PXE9_9PROT|nr:DUF167 domain-containing protein [Arboricoccus pini]SNB51675.1 hypothetical protein SAMN07250955_101121 [Arboricoccus pini]